MSLVVSKYCLKIAFLTPRIKFAGEINARQLYMLIKNSARLSLYVLPKLMFSFLFPLWTMMFLMVSEVIYKRIFAWTLKYSHVSMDIQMIAVAFVITMLETLRICFLFAVQSTHVFVIRSSACASRPRIFFSKPRNFNKPRKGFTTWDMLFYKLYFTEAVQLVCTIILHKW